MAARWLQPASRSRARSAPEGRRTRPGPHTLNAPSPLATFSLAIDAMGGDDAPEMVVEGVAIAAERHPGARFLLVGDEQRLAPLLDRNKRAGGACKLRHAPDMIDNELKPTAALRMRQASMRIAI